MSKIMGRNTKIIIGIVLSLIIAASIVYPWYKMGQTSKREEMQAQANIEQQLLLTSFTNQYQGNSTLLEYIEPEKIYLVAREYEGDVLLSMYIDGIWIELGTLGEFDRLK